MGRTRGRLRSPITVSAANTHPITATAGSNHHERSERSPHPLVEPLLVENGRHLIELAGEVVTEIPYEQFSELGVFRYYGACRVGIDQDIRQVPERRFRSKWFVTKNVQRGEGDSPFVQAAQKGLFVDDGAAPDVHEDCARLERGKF